MSWEENNSSLDRDYSEKRRNRVGEALEVKGTVTLKGTNGKSFKIGTDWYSATEPAQPYLAAVSVGDEVVVKYLKNKAFRNVLTIAKVEHATDVEQEEESSAEFTCEVCGKELKDGKYKKCFMCNKSGAVKKSESPKEEVKENKGQFQSFYGSPEDIAGKQKGCTLGAAGAAVAGNFPGAQPADIAEAMIIIARRGLEYLQE